MNLRLFPLILVLVLLCGCAPGTEAESMTPQPSAAVSAPRAEALYAPDSSIEQRTQGAVRCYPLPVSDRDSSTLMLEEGILLLQDGEGGTVLTLLTGDTLLPAARAELSCFLTVGSAALQTFSGGLSYFDSAAGETVVLDERLREVRRVAAPADITGVPLLSRDGSTLYYCTADAIRALELDTGISRVLKQIAYPAQGLAGLWMEDTVLQCTLSSDGRQSTLFLSTDTGQTLSVYSGDLRFDAYGEHYYAQTDGTVTEYLFGTTGSQTQALTPGISEADCTFLPKEHAAVLLSRQKPGTVTLDYCDLGTGLRTASLSFPSDTLPWNICSAGDGLVCFLCYDPDCGSTALYLWDTSMTPTEDSNIYTGPHYTRENPDYEGLAECTLYAQEISRRHGVNVLVYKDATAVEPWDYTLEPEYRANVLMRELQLLDQRLSHYPEGFLETVSGQITGLTICLVSDIAGASGAKSLDTANGLQFWEGYHAYIALSTGANTEGTLYHELCHLIDTVVLTQSHAYDQWDSLNPTGFRYDNDYIANQTRNSTEYLREEARYFIDMYSMSFAKEDRARIMEYAMTAGNAHYFSSPYMQAKLLQLCTGIRDAFGLKKSEESFLWEQYLEEPLAHSP